MPYIATKPGTAFRTFTDKDTFSGDGSTTVFDMQFAIAEAGQNDLQVFVGGTLKIPGTDFTLGVDGTGEYKRITFTSAPANGTNNIVVLNPGTVEGELATVADNAITSGKVNTDVITGQTELAEAAANNDTLLIHDTSASALKKIQVSNLTAQAGDGLSKTNSTLSVDIPNTTLLDAGAATNDEILVYDTSATALRSITQTNFLNFPVVSSVSPTNVLTGDGTGNHTIVITGTGFAGATASLLNASGSPVSFASQTIDSATQITGTIAKSDLPGSGEPYDVRVQAASGLQSTLENQINVDQSPVFSTAAGSLGSVADGARGSASFTVAAADPESGGDVVYTLESGSLPAGCSLTSTSSGAVLSGFNAVGSNTTSTFTIRAKDAASNTSDRQFTITVLAPVTQSYTSSGTFSVPSGLTSVDVLVVAGGGGGGADNGGGGGAGGLIYRPGFPVTPGSTITVTVGDGGPTPGQNNYTNDIRGSDSVFGTLTAKGGGGGGTQSTHAGQPGGSGGGGNGHSGPGAGKPGGSATQPTQPGDSGNYGFGNAGSAGYVPGQMYAGGGGGAGAAGGPNAGGVGKAYTIADGTTSVYYAGGGGGGSNGLGDGPGGQGGAGNGGSPGTAGQANRGGGGGGGNNSNPRPGGSGGKGVVIVKY